MKKICSRCKIEKNTKDFGPLKTSKDKLKYSCRACENEKMQISRKKDPSKEREKQKRWRRSNPDRTRLRDRRANIARYGITLEQFDTMMLKQNNLCPICKGNLLDKINLIFKILDTNDQGYITKEYIDNYINIILRFLKKFSYNTNTFVYINFTNNMHSLKNLNDKINKNKFIDWHLNNKLFNTNKIKYFTTNYISISS